MSAICPAFLAALDPALCRAVDHYCERVGNAWHAEPLNAVTNFAFVVAGWLVWRLATRRMRLAEDRLLTIVIAIIPAIGVGSFTFHTLATRWAEWIDVIPILLFMLLYVWLVMTRFFGWPGRVKLPILLAFLVATLTLEIAVPPSVLWGGAMYLPTIVALLGLAAAPARLVRRVRGSFCLAVPVFLLAFALRTLDAPLCDFLPFGTHFLWHLFNALLAYLLARAAILHRVPAPIVAVTAGAPVRGAAKEETMGAMQDSNLRPAV
jgi:hypothetical protein